MDLHDGKDTNRIVFRFMMGLLLIQLLVALIGCGQKESGGGSPSPQPNPITCSTLQGVYDNNDYPGETLTVNGDCTFTDSICGYDAQYSIPNADTGATTVVINNTNGTPGCMASIAHPCTIAYNGDDLHIKCDNNTYQYFFDKR